MQTAFPEGGWAGGNQGNFLSSGRETILEPQIRQRYENVERKRDTNTLLFSLKGPEILHQERWGQVKILVMEHFYSILFHKSEHANKKKINQLLDRVVCK